MAAVTARIRFSIFCFRISDRVAVLMTRWKVSLSCRFISFVRLGRISPTSISLYRSCRTS